MDVCEMCQRFGTGFDCELSDIHGVRSRLIADDTDGADVPSAETAGAGSRRRLRRAGTAEQMVAGHSQAAARTVVNHLPNLRTFPTWH
jgi:hypothetical protein